MWVEKMVQKLEQKTVGAMVDQKAHHLVVEKVAEMVVQLVGLKDEMLAAQLAVC